MRRVVASVTEEADIGDWPKGADVSIRLIRGIAAAAKAEPSLNAWYNSQAGERRLILRIDVGIAIDTEGGLIVPVMRNVGERDANDLRAGLDRMRVDAAARSIPPDRTARNTSQFGTDVISACASALLVSPPTHKKNKNQGVGDGRQDRHANEGLLGQRALLARLCAAG